MTARAESIKLSTEHRAFLKKKRMRRFFVCLAQITCLALIFSVWEFAAIYHVVDPFIFSQPSRMLKTAYSMTVNGSLLYHIWVTFSETVVGFIIGTVMGTLFAILLWWNEFVKDVFEPYLVVLNSLPKTALAPILIVWVGANKGSIIVTAVLTSVIVTILTVLTGFLACDPDKLKLIKTFSGTKKQILTKVLLPSSIPVIISALKINVGLSFVGVIVGEFLVAKDGLGYLIVYGSQIFKLDWVMMSVIILAIMAAFMYKIIVELEKKFLKWNE